jgi:hypothetical protein
MAGFRVVKTSGSPSVADGRPLVNSFRNEAERLTAHAFSRSAVGWIVAMERRLRGGEAQWLSARGSIAFAQKNEYGRTGCLSFGCVYLPLDSCKRLRGLKVFRVGKRTVNLDKSTI